MSTREIIAELDKLTAAERREIRAKLDEVEQGGAATPSAGEQEPLSDFLLRFAGRLKGLPSDLSEEHDHYLYGTPKRSSNG